MWRPKCYFYYSSELLIQVKVKILLRHWKPFVLSLFFMILLKNIKCDCTLVTHPKNPACTHIRTHKSMKLRTSVAPRFQHARVWRTHAHSHTNTLLLEHMHKKFEINRSKIKGGCQSGRKVVTHISKSDLPLAIYPSMMWEWSTGHI